MTFPNAQACCTIGMVVFAGVAGALGQSANVSKISWESESQFAVVGGSEFRNASASSDVDLLQFGTRNVASLQIKEGFLFRFGFEFERFHFSHTGRSGVPGKLQEASLVLGADLQLGEAWIVRFEIQPGFYGSSATVRARDVNVPIAIGGSYFVSSDLQLVAGVSVDVGRKYPVLPAVGVRWRWSETVVLDAILPSPRIEYSLSKSLLFYLGADLEDSSYRMDSEFEGSRGNHTLHNAVTEYTQVRVGGGLSWKVRSGMTVDLEAGCVPVQEFDFHRADVRLRSHGVPPYAAISLKANF